MFYKKIWYQPEKDGTLEEYLETHDGLSCTPLFKGYEHYQMLWDKGYFDPEIGVVRLMWNVGRDDEHFIVLGKYKIKGCNYLPAHAGRPGIHDPRKLLSEKTCPPWEAQSLNPRPKPRK